MNINVINHPLIQHKVSMMRDKNTPTRDFRALVEEISMLMAYEVTRDLPLTDMEIETPICKATVKTLAGRSIGMSCPVSAIFIRSSSPPEPLSFR